MNEAPLLALDEVACLRGGRLLFERLSLRLEAGGAALVTGPNGAGKSSLLRLLAGLLPVAGGRLSNPFRLAWLGHDNALKVDRTAAAELRFWGGLDRVPRVQEALDRFGLAPLADLPVRVLSSGQRRRLALARVWQSGAPLWLLDEPSVGLDDASIALLARACAEHRAGGGMVMAATHVPLGLEGADMLRIERRDPSFDATI